MPWRILKRGQVIREPKQRMAWLVLQPGRSFCPTQESFCPEQHILPVCTWDSVRHRKHSPPGTCRLFMQTSIQSQRWLVFLETPSGETRLLFLDMRHMAMVLFWEKPSYSSPWPGAEKIMRGSRFRHQGSAWMVLRTAYAVQDPRRIPESCLIWAIEESQFQLWMKLESSEKKQKNGTKAKTVLKKQKIRVNRKSQTRTPRAGTDPIGCFWVLKSRPQQQQKFQWLTPWQRASILFHTPVASFSFSSGGRGEGEDSNVPAWWMVSPDEESESDRDSCSSWGHETLLALPVVVTR